MRGENYVSDKLNALNRNRALQLTKNEETAVYKVFSEKTFASIRITSVMEVSLRSCCTQTTS